LKPDPCLILDPETLDAGGATDFVSDFDKVGPFPLELFAPQPDGEGDVTWEPEINSCLDNFLSPLPLFEELGIVDDEMVLDPLPFEEDDVNDSDIGLTLNVNGLTAIDAIAESAEVTITDEVVTSAEGEVKGGGINDSIGEGDGEGEERPDLMLSTDSDRFRFRIFEISSRPAKELRLPSFDI